MNRVRHVLPVLATAVGLTTLALIPLGSASGSTPPLPGATCHWKVVQSADLGPDPSSLGASDALGDDDVWAVGSVGGFAHEKTVVEHFDGTAWSRMKTPNPRQQSTDGNVLSGVDALAPDDVWAVGTHFINGQTDSRPLILHWNGAKWRVVPNPSGNLSGGFLRGVVTVSADDVWAVGQVANGGSEGDPLILHWNGAAWSISGAVNPDGFEADTLAAVTAVSKDDVWAVGRAQEATTLTEHWNGKRWKIVPSPTPGGDAHAGLSGIVQFGANNLWAVGASSSTYGSITLHWDGTWQVVVNRHQPQFDALSAVAARSASDIWAVGQNQTPDQDHLTFGEHFDGSDWSLSQPVSPGSYDALFGVSATSKAIWAVGSSATDSQAVPHALVERHC